VSSIRLITSRIPIGFFVLFPSLLRKKEPKILPEKSPFVNAKPALTQPKMQKTGHFSARSLSAGADFA
jgi:hypothetical protein